MCTFHLHIKLFTGTVKGLIAILSTSTSDYSNRCFFRVVHGLLMQKQSHDMFFGELSDHYLLFLSAFECYKLVIKSDLYEKLLINKTSFKKEYNI